MLTLVDAQTEGVVRKSRAAIGNRSHCARRGGCSDGQSQENDQDDFVHVLELEG